MLVYERALVSFLELMEFPTLRVPGFLVSQCVPTDHPKMTPSCDFHQLELFQKPVLLIPSKIEWDRIPTDLTKKVAIALLETQVFSGPFSGSCGLEISWIDANLIFVKIQLCTLTIHFFTHRFAT